MAQSADASSASAPAGAGSASSRTASRFSRSGRASCHRPRLSCSRCLLHQGLPEEGQQDGCRRCARRPGSGNVTAGYFMKSRLSQLCCYTGHQACRCQDQQAFRWNTRAPPAAYLSGATAAALPMKRQSCGSAPGRSGSSVNARLMWLPRAMRRYSTLPRGTRGGWWDTGGAAGVASKSSAISCCAQKVLLVTATPHTHPCHPSQLSRAQPQSSTADQTPAWWQHSALLTCVMVR